ncbi:MAG: hypothetical protein H6Q50_602 [Deltaproteobacteria bacterium]|nr:hypothetical protein [Deltaproteobacteria bacterium]
MIKGAQPLLFGYSAFGAVNVPGIEAHQKHIR